MLTRITDRKIPCVYIHVYRITKNWGPGPYNSLRHADNKIFFGSLSNAKSKGSAHVLLGEGSGKIWTCSCWEKSNFIMINEFKYGQTWKFGHLHLVYHFTIPLRIVYRNWSSRFRDWLTKDEWVTKRNGGSLATKTYNQNWTNLGIINEIVRFKEY